MEIIDNNQTPWPDEFAKKYKDANYWQGKSLATILSESAYKYENNIALVDGEKSWTYSALDQKARELASGFWELGIQAGDKVVVQLPNRGEFFEVLFALFYIGAVPIATLPSHRYLEIEYFCSFTDAKAYIVADVADNFDYRKLARQLVEEKAINEVIVVGEAQEFRSLQTLYKPTRTFSEIDPSKLGLLQLSGGTTNIPKLIPRTHDDYLYSIVASAEICELSSSSVYLTVLPVGHNFPLTSPGALGIFHAGGTVIMSTTGAPDTAFELIEKHRVTITAMVPPLALAWLNAVPNSEKDLSSLEVIQVGGSKLSEDIAKKIEPAFGCTLQQVFGMAEGLVNYTRLDDPDEIIIQTQGRPISPDDEIKIVDEEDNEVPVGEPGLLLTRGPYTIRGYFRATEHNAEAFTKDGFYRTGDIVRLTPDGYLIVEGRNKDQINRGGEKISIAEVENQLINHPNIHNVAVVSMPDPYLGERSCAFVVLKGKSVRLRTIEVRNFLRNIGVAEFKIPDRVEPIDAFPKTPLGKINKKQLREIIAAKVQTQVL